MKYINFKSYALVLSLLCLSVALSAQVRGTVKAAENGEVLPGVSVQVKGTTTGSVTDINGNFSINAKPEDVLRVTYVGFNTVEVKVGAQTSINIVLETNSTLDEVVVTALGIERDKKRSVTRFLK